MGDSARTKRREQLKRWAGSCTDKASALPRRRGDALERGSEEPEADLQDPPTEQPILRGDESSPLLKRRWVKPLWGTVEHNLSALLASFAPRSLSEEWEEDLCGDYKWTTSSCLLAWLLYSSPCIKALYGQSDGCGNSKGPWYLSLMLVLGTLKRCSTFDKLNRNGVVLLLLTGHLLEFTHHCVAANSRTTLFRYVSIVCFLNPV